MVDQAELGAFLKARRAALDPQDLGLPQGVTRRRVAGLRREELAQLAGISVDYLTRLEQGRARNVSDEVLDSLARALRFTPDERRYLHNLATPRRKRPVRSPAQQVRPALQQLLDAMAVPAFILGRYLDVLTWNPMGGAIAFDFGSVPPEERNMPKLIFLNEDEARVLHPEFDQVCQDLVANLRAEAGRCPDDPRLAQLIGELSLGSDLFRRLWAGHRVREKAHGHKLIRNPLVGDLHLRYETLRLPDEPDQALVTYTAEPGSESERALELLAAWVSTDHLDQATLRRAAGG
ncbi:helix-turn-helix transcriptional regulator [Amycolatopsis thermophila]|uniref:Transcriptional regulator with XRE-family HTH domain n=1 Tax=Amycolatopsis thermophila TaxID=206084 RepID=A0ABU0EWQ4_9PSEU|nr:helix-turn-helix transcriptional regulator [Amycolatopsis thermophila]MDQ0379237.1 transcriptional regulator with XRE-family HTH domain [Amycolatopsis thermophila]